MSNYFKKSSKEERTNILAQYIPDWSLFCEKNIENTPIRNLLKGMAGGFADVYTTINTYLKEGNIIKANALIVEWESLFGLPDGCLNNMDTLQQRVNNLLIKLSGLQSNDFVEQVNYALNLLGLGDITIKTAYERCSYPLQYPIYYIDEEEIPFTIFVQLPPELKVNVYTYTYPIKYDGTIPQIQCIMNIFKPANIKVIYEFETTQATDIAFLATENNEFLTMEGGGLLVL